MQIEVKTDIKKAIKDFGRIPKKNIPFGVATGLTKTAFNLTQAERRLASRQLDKPTPFTMKSFRYEKANYREYSSGRMSARSFVLPPQAEYLIYTVKGGIRFPKGKAIAVPYPKNKKPNAYGNIPKGSIARLLAKPDVFQGTVKGVSGVWQRPKYGTQRSGKKGRKGKTGLKLLIAYEPFTRHTKRPYKYYEFANRYVKRNVQKHVKAGLAQAIKPKPSKR